MVYHCPLGKLGGLARHSSALQRPCQQPPHVTCYRRRHKASTTARAEREGSSSDFEEAKVDPESSSVNSSLDALDNLLGEKLGEKLEKISSQLTQESLPGEQRLAGSAGAFTSSELQAGVAASPLWSLAQELAVAWLKDQVKKPPRLEEVGVCQSEVKVIPRLSYMLLGANVLVYAIGLSVGWLEGGSSGEDYFNALAKVDEAVDVGEYYRLLSCNFLHDSFAHLALNCYALYCLAPEVEAVLGYSTFLAVYMVSGVAGAVATYIASDAITVGASGAVFGLVGALGAYLFKNTSSAVKDMGGSGPSEQLWFLAGIAAINLALGALEETSIDNVGHMGGLIAGAAMAAGMASPTFKSMTPQLPTSVDSNNGLEEKAVESGEGTAEATSSSPATGWTIHGTPGLQWWGTLLGFSAVVATAFALELHHRIDGPLPPPQWLDVMYLLRLD